MLEDRNLFFQRVSGRTGVFVAVDYGTRKLGFAVSDDDRQIAFPKDVLIGDWRDFDTVFSAISEYVSKFNVCGIVLGWPKKMDGSLHENCEIILKIAKKLTEKFPVLLADERFTTRATYAVERFERQKFGSKNKTKFKEKNDDARAAAIILNDVLDGLNRGQSA